MQQSAIDSNCAAEDFTREENKIVISVKSPFARKYLELPFLCDFTSYGSNIVASVSQELYGVAEEFLARVPFEHCFETPSMHLLIEKLRPIGLNVCFMAEYFLPDVENSKEISCAYETRIIEREQLGELNLTEWRNALRDGKSPTALAVGAFDEGRLVGLAASSADCDTMWQIGIDVLPNYRRQGIASCLTSKLAQEVLAKNIVPFYCCAWSNIRSVRNAIKSGFRPAWVQMTVKTEEFINKLNEECHSEDC